MVRASNDEMVRQILEMRAKARHEEASRLYQAEKRGIEKGIEKGREEEKLTIARNMLKLNLSLEAISRATGLSIDKLNKLK